MGELSADVFLVQIISCEEVLEQFNWRVAKSDMIQMIFSQIKGFLDYRKKHWQPPLIFRRGVFNFHLFSPLHLKVIDKHLTIPLAMVYYKLLLFGFLRKEKSYLAYDSKEPEVCILKINLKQVPLV